MSNNDINRQIIEQVTRATQAIDGYKEANKEVVQKAKELRERYGIKVSAKNKSYGLMK